MKKTGKRETVKGKRKAKELSPFHRENPLPICSQIELQDLQGEILFALSSEVIYGSN